MSGQSQQGSAVKGPAVTGPAVAGPAVAGPAVLEVADLTVRFGAAAAVRGVDFALRRGEVLGIVGESGSGKSLTALAVLGLLPAGAVADGSVRLDGTELLGAPESTLNAVRGNRIAMVFQDPLTAFTPVYRIGEQIAEAIRTHQDVSRQRAALRAVELLDLVGIPEPAVRAGAFPHEFSGGMRQRAMIAMAIANDPDVILADEPTTALDVTIQAQVLDVLRTAQRETGAAMVLVSHDLGVIAGSADRVAVMYAGRIVETAPVDELFARPRMPYTLGLLGAVPRLDGAGPGGGGAAGVLVPIPGVPPSPGAVRAGHVPGPGEPSGGCSFAPRCPLAEPACRTAEPDLVSADGTVQDASRADRLAAGEPQLGGGGPQLAAGEPHLAACLRAGEILRRRLGPADVFPVPPLPARAPAATGREGAEGPVLRVRGLTKTFPLFKGAVFKRRTGSVYAVDGVDLDIGEGETLGLVGESGSGKSTTLFEILGLKRPESGGIEVLGRSTDELTRRQAQALRSRLAIVFQDPMASLDPRMPIADIIAEPLHALGTERAVIRRRIPELLRLVGLEAAHARRFPHEFSGGQRQRIGIARALAADPRLLVLDEPVSALDVSIQAGVLNLLQRLKAELGLAYLFVSHDLSVVRHIADRVSVMYMGRTVEAGTVADVFTRPRHPYTQALLSAVPLPDPPRERARERILLVGDPGSPTRRETGCRFRSRCPVFATLGGEDRDRCARERPALRAEPGGGQVAACHFPRVRAVL